MSGLGLADLFDLEIRTLEERGENEETRRSRYRNLGRRLLDQEGQATDGGALLKGLLRLEPQARTPGSRFEAAVGWLSTLLAAAGLLLGASVSLGLLHYAGDHPVNILNVLAALVGSQLVLLVLLLLALVPRSGHRAPGPVQGLLRLGLRKLLARFLHDAGPERLKNLEDRLDSHRGLLRWLLVRAAQVFGVSFNVAVLAGCLFRILFSDVAFGWSTTLRFDAGAFHHLVTALSAPWAWIFPQAVPSLQLVELTQYSHLEGKYLLRLAGERSANPSIVGGWWPFLLLSLGTYGLLPRLLVLALAGIRVRGILRRIPIRNEEFRRLCEWMGLPVVTTLAEGPETTPPVPPAGSSEPEPPLPARGSSCQVLLDGTRNLPREDLDRLIEDRFGWTVAGLVSSGDSGSAEMPLVVVLSAWEEPTKGHQRPFRDLRRGAKDRLIVVGLLDSSSTGDDPRLEKIRERWKRHLQGVLGDARHRVESLGGRR